MKPFRGIHRLDGSNFAKSIIALYLFNETFGDIINDNSGGFDNASTTNSPAWIPEGLSLSSGSSQRVNSAFGNLIQDGNAWTIAFRCMFTDLTGTYHYPFGMPNTGGGNYRQAQYRTSSGQMYFRNPTTGAYTRTTSNLGLVVNTWYSFVFTAPAGGDLSDVLIYFNGELQPLSATGSLTYTSGADTSYLGYDAIITYTSIAFDYFYVCNKFICDYEVKQLNADPFYFFDTSITPAFSVVGADVNVNVNTATLSLTTYQSDISADIDIDVSTETLSITTYQTDISTDIDIDVNLATLTITTQQTDIFVDTEIDVNTATLSITTYSPDISADIDIDVNIGSLAIVIFQPDISIDVEITANTSSLTITTYKPDIDADIDIDVNVIALTITTHDATIDTGLLATGEVSFVIAAVQPGITFTAVQPGVTIVAVQAGVTII